MSTGDIDGRSRVMAAFVIFLRSGKWPNHGYHIYQVDGNALNNQYANLYPPTRKPPNYHSAKSKEYKNLSCVYVRYVEYRDAYYVGKAADLSMRYYTDQLSEIIYYEQIKSPLERSIREHELYWEFKESGLNLINLKEPSMKEPAKWGRGRNKKYEKERILLGSCVQQPVFEVVTLNL